MTRSLAGLVAPLVLLAGCGSSGATDFAAPVDAAVADRAAPATDATAAVDLAAGPDLGARDGAAPDLACAGAGNCKCGAPVCQDGAWTCPASCADLGSPGDGGASGCSPACLPGNICIRDQILGGAIVLPMNGMCPAMTHLQNNQCVRDPTYICLPSPQGCAGPISCACAGNICLIQQACPYRCVSASANQIDCECDVP